MIRLAIPKGRLWPESLRLARGLGVPVQAGDRRYVFRHPELELEVIALKSPDIPSAVADRLVDYAISADEWLAEHGGRVVAMTPLCWYHVRVCVLAPAGQSGGSAEQLTASGRGLTVATPYPALATKLLGGAPRFAIRKVVGGTEAFPGRLTDLAVDCVETGETMRANGLVELDELLRCDVRLVAGAGADADHPASRHLRSFTESYAIDSRCDFGETPVSGRPRPQ